MKRLISGAACVALQLSAWPVLAADGVMPAARPVGGPGAGSVLEVVLGLVFVISAIFFVAWVFRRAGRFEPGVNSRLRVVGGLSLGTRERLVLVQAGDQQILLGVAPGRVSSLHVLDEPLEVDDSTPNGFALRLGEALGGLKARAGK